MRLKIENGMATGIADDTEQAQTIELAPDAAAQVTASSLTGGMMDEFILAPLKDTTFRIYVMDMSAEALKGMLDKKLLTVTRKYADTAALLRITVTDTLQMEANINSTDFNSKQQTEFRNAHPKDHDSYAAPVFNYLEGISHNWHSHTKVPYFTLGRVMQNLDNFFNEPVLENLTCGQLRALTNEEKSQLRKTIEAITFTKEGIRNQALVTADIASDITRYLI